MDIDSTPIGALIGFAGIITAILLKVVPQSKRRPVPDWTKHWMKKLRSDNWVEREEALRQLSHPDCKPAVPKIVRLLNNEKNWDVAAQAVRTLNNIGDPRCINDLVKALYYIHREVRGEAAEALGNFGDRTVIPELIQIVEHDNDSNVRYNAIVALGFCS